MPSRRPSRYTITTATAALPTAPPMPGPPLPDPVHQTHIPRIKLMAIREASLPYPARRISHSQHVFELLHDYFHGHDREEMLAILLDSKNCIIGLHTISIGSLTLSIVHPRETFKAAVLMNAAGLILAHNLCGAPHKLCYVTFQIMWSSCRLTRLFLHETCKSTVSSST